MARSWRRQQGLANALTALLCVGVGAEVLALFALVRQRIVVDDGRGDISSIYDADRLIIRTTVWATLVTIPIAATFIVWLWRAAKNNEVLGQVRPRLEPGWAIGGWFIPLANFVLPVLLVQDLWRGSDASVRRGDSAWHAPRSSSVVGAWWGLLVASVVIRFASAPFAFEGGGEVLVDTISGSFVPDESVTRFETENSLAVIGVLLALAAAVLAIGVVRDLTRRQEQALATQQLAWQQGAPNGPPSGP